MRGARRYLHVEMPIALACAETVVFDQHEVPADRMLDLMTKAKRPSVIRIEIQIEILPRIRATEANEPIPIAAELQIGAAAKKPTGG